MLWDHTQLYLIMDYVEQDLRQFMDTDACSRSLRNVKVAIPNLSSSSCQRRSASFAFCWTVTSAYLYMGGDCLHLGIPQPRVSESAHTQF